MQEEELVGSPIKVPATVLQIPSQMHKERK